MTAHNQIRPGYKQTEVGVIPEDWDVSTVGELFNVQLGKMLDEEKNRGVLKSYLGNRAVQWGRVDCDDLPQMRMSISDLTKFRLKRGDILVCEGGEVGRAAIWDAPIEECYFQKALHRLRATREFDHGLMVALLENYSDRGFFGNYTTQTSIAHLPREKFVQVPIAVPPPPEQRAIAGALSDADALIASLDTLAAKKHDLKRAAVQQLLTGKTRLPGFGGDWELKQLSELCSMKSGEGITAKNIDDFSRFPCFGGNGLRGFTTRFTHDGRYCLIGRVGALCGNLLEVSGRFFASEHAIVVTAFEDTDVSWLTRALGMLSLNRRAESSAQPVLTVSKLLLLEVLSPPTKDEQSAIAAVLSDIDAELAALEARRNKARAIKQGVMQELLTGRIRLV